MLFFSSPFSSRSEMCKQNGEHQLRNEKKNTIRIMRIQLGFNMLVRSLEIHIVYFVCSDGVKCRPPKNANNRFCHKWIFFYFEFRFCVANAERHAHSLLLLRWSDGFSFLFFRWTRTRSASRSTYVWLNLFALVLCVGLSTSRKLDTPHIGTIKIETTAAAQWPGIVHTKYSTQRSKTLKVCNAFVCDVFVWHCRRAFNLIRFVPLIKAIFTHNHCHCHVLRVRVHCVH